MGRKREKSEKKQRRKHREERDARGRRAAAGGHVFLSYAHEDRDRVTPILHCFAEAGLEVFWDGDLEPGDVWSQVLAERLADASCVVVAWSRYSVESVFVRAEARTALNRFELDGALDSGVLVPVRLDPDVTPPLPFGELQELDLSSWKDGSCDALAPLTRVARRLASREAGRHREATLVGNDWSTRQAEDALAQLDQLTVDLRPVAELVMRAREPADDLRGALREVHRTYDVVSEAIETFVEAAVAKDSSSRKAFARLERGRLKKRIRKGRGHCTAIAHLYGRRGGLREWIQRNGPEVLAEADRLLGRLSSADGDLFQSLTEIGSTLTSESRAIVNLLVARQRSAARERIRAGRERLLPLEDALEEATEKLEELEGELGLTSP